MVDMRHLKTPIPDNHTRKRPWDYKIKLFKDGSYRLIRGADL